MKIPIISNWLEKRISESAYLRKILTASLSGGSRAGVSVTPDSAMRTTAVWACVRVLSTSYAALPLHVYSDNGSGGSEKAVNNPWYEKLRKAPNPEQSSFTFRQASMAQICLYGNAYAEIEFDNFGNPVALWPIPSWCCEPQRNEKKELFYHVTVPNTGENRNLQPYRVLHVMGLSTDGMKGLSPIRQAMETIGISMAAEQFAGSFFGQGMNVGAVAEHPKQLSSQGSENLRKSLNEKYAGLGNANRLLLLEEGMKFQKVGISPEEAQFIETRQFQVEDIARIFGVQLHKIGHLLHATFSNIEHQGIEFVTDTMLPWVVNFEQEYDRKLFYNSRFYTKHSLEGLLRGDTVARAAFYRELFYLGALSADEIREKEEMNPEPNGIGNRYYVQANMVPADKVDSYLASREKPGLTDAVKRIAERDRQNILNAYQRDPGKFTEWLGSYYRDFPAYMISQLAGKEE